MPWEKYRALRLLNVITAKNIRWVEQKLSLAEKGAEFCYYADESLAYGPGYALIERIDLPLMSVGLNEPFWRYDFSRQLRASRNAAMVSMALLAWKLERGSLPKTLGELAGSYFEKVPTDPFNCRNFRYFPEGLPIALTGANGGWGLWINGEYESYQFPTYIPAKQPFLWSIGSQIYDMGPPNDDKVADSPIVRYRMSYTRQWPQIFRQQPASEMQVWSSGLIFPLP